jgi:hypothetical protein
VRPLERAVDAGRRRLERAGDLAGREAEDVAEDQHGALAPRQVLERRDEGELDALALLVAGLGPGEPVLQAERVVRIRIDPERLEQGLRGPVVRVGRRAVVDGQHATRPALDRPQARVGRDGVQPRAQRAAPLEPGEPAPRAQQRVLERVLGVGHRAEHAVAVGVERAAVGLDELGEGALVAAARRLEQARLAHAASRAGGRRRFGCQNAISAAVAVATTLRHPAGPSRGSRTTAAPSARARSVAPAMSPTST